MHISTSEGWIYDDTTTTTTTKSRLQILFWHFHFRFGDPTPPGSPLQFSWEPVDPENHRFFLLCFPELLLCYFAVVRYLNIGSAIGMDLEHWYGQRMDFWDQIIVNWSKLFVFRFYPIPNRDSMHKQCWWIYKEMISIGNNQIQYHCLPSDNYVAAVLRWIFDVIRPQFMTQGGHYQHYHYHYQHELQDKLLSPVSAYYIFQKLKTHFACIFIGSCLATKSHLQFIDSGFFVDLLFPWFPIFLVAPLIVQVLFAHFFPDSNEGQP